MKIKWGKFYVINNDSLRICNSIVYINIINGYEFIYTILFSVIKKTGLQLQTCFIICFLCPLRAYIAFKLRSKLRI